MKRLFVAVLLLGLVLPAGCSRASDYQPAEDPWVLEQEKVITFSDGESADLWSWGNRVPFYKLRDGTLLLSISGPTGPESVSGGGVESYADLTEAAQKAVSVYFDQQGLLYDTDSELEKAYADYLACKADGTEFQSRYVSQDIYPTASNEKIMGFATSVMLPVDRESSQELRLGAVFDRKTGEALSIWDLFTVPEAEARQRLLDAYKLADPVLRAEMEAALKPEYIVLFPDYLYVTFPQGSLPSQQYGYIFDIDYDKLRDVLQTWAIPNKQA